MTQRNREIIERTARQRRRRGRGGLKRRRRRRRRKGRMMKKRYTLPGALQADASTCTCMHTHTFVRAVSVSPGAKARNHAAWKKEEEEEEGPLRPSGPHRCTEDGPGGTRGGVPHHEPRRGATVVPLRARKREEIAASFVHPPHPLPCLLAAKGGGHRGGGGGGGGIHGAPRTFSETIRCSWTLRRLHDGPLASPLLLLFSFRFSFSPFIRFQPPDIRPRILYARSCFAVFKQEDHLRWVYILLLFSRVERSRLFLFLFIVDWVLYRFRIY